MSQDKKKDQGSRKKRERDPEKGGSDSGMFILLDSSGNVTALNVQPSDTIKEVKDRIQKAKDIPAEWQVLQFLGVKLKDSRTLEDCGIHNGDALTLVVKVIWGAPSITCMGGGGGGGDGIAGAGGAAPAEPKVTAPRGSMQITVKTETGKSITLDVEPFDTIETVKKELEKRERVPLQWQILTFSGVSLKDPRTLADYNIRRGALLSLKLAVLVR